MPPWIGGSSACADRCWRTAGIEYRGDANGASRPTSSGGKMQLVGFSFT
jgi:hypothetical protein